MFYIHFTCKFLLCSFSRSADWAGQVQTPPRLPLCFSSALALAQMRRGRGKIVTKGTSTHLCHRHLIQILTTTSLTRTQREKTVTPRNKACYHSTKQVKAQSQTWRGFMSPPSSPHERPALHMRVLCLQVAIKTSPSLQFSHPAGRAVQLPKTALSLLLHRTGTPKIWRSQSGAKASLLLESRVRVTTVRVKINLLTSHSSLCLRCAPPP